MDSILKTKADARRRLGNSADGVASVAAFLMTQEPTKDTLDAIEVLSQNETILRKLQGFPCLKED